MSRKATPESIALNARIVMLKTEGYSWAQIGERVELSKQACAERAKATKASAAEVIALRHENSKLRTQLARMRAILDEADEGMNEQAHPADSADMERQRTDGAAGEG